MAYDPATLSTMLISMPSFNDQLIQ